MRNPFKGHRNNGILAMVLTLLGLAPACDIITPCMYGSPSADWSVKGKVIDEEGKGVEGLQVVVINYFPNSAGVIYDVNDQPLDTLRTAQDGAYGVDGHGFPLNQLKIKVEDIDGEEGGGEFVDATIVVSDIQYKNGDRNWYEGHADINVPDIVVYKKK